MICISFLLVAIGVASAVPAGFLLDTPEVQFAKANFIAEYNRLAKLAADAPDIYMYTQRPLDPNQPQPVVRQSIPAPLSRQALEALNVYSFQATLGDQSQYIPANYVHPSTRRSSPVVYTQRAAAPVVINSPQPSTDYSPWTGPWAHTVPAGLSGAPAQVTYTPEVKAARDAHFRAVAAAHAQTAQVERNTVVNGGGRFHYY